MSYADTVINSKPTLFSYTSGYNPGITCNVKLDKIENENKKYLNEKTVYTFKCEESNDNVCYIKLYNIKLPSKDEELKGEDLSVLPKKEITIKKDCIQKETHDCHKMEYEIFLGYYSPVSYECSINDIRYFKCDYDYIYIHNIYYGSSNIVGEPEFIIKFNQHIHKYLFNITYFSRAIGYYTNTKFPITNQNSLSLPHIPFYDFTYYDMLLFESILFGVNRYEKMNNPNYHYFNTITNLRVFNKSVTQINNYNGDENNKKDMEIHNTDKYVSPINNYEHELYNLIKKRLYLLTTNVNKLESEWMKNYISDYKKKYFIFDNTKITTEFLYGIYNMSFEVFLQKITERPGFRDKYIDESETKPENNCQMETVVTVNNNTVRLSNSNPVPQTTSAQTTSAQTTSSQTTSDKTNSTNSEKQDINKSNKGNNGNQKSKKKTKTKSLSNVPKKQPGNEVIAFINNEKPKPQNGGGSSNNRKKSAKKNNKSKKTTNKASNKKSNKKQSININGVRKLYNSIIASRDKPELQKQFIGKTLRELSKNFIPDYENDYLITTNNNMEKIDYETLHQLTIAQQFEMVCYQWRQINPSEYDKFCSGNCCGNKPTCISDLLRYVYLYNDHQFLGTIYPTDAQKDKVKLAVNILLQFLNHIFRFYVSCDYNNSVIPTNRDKINEILATWPSLSKVNNFKQTYYPIYV